MQSLDKHLEVFRQSGLKITPQRRIILELMLNNEGHPTADEIYQRVLEVMPEVSRTTIYNTLREMVGLGILNEVHDISGGGLRYDTNTGVHHHLFCTRCHTLIDIDREFEGILLAPEETAGYQILKHQVTFYGICPDCQQNVQD